MVPTIGRIVMYRSKTANYVLPAMVTATMETLWPEGVETGQVPALSSPLHVHLQVFTPGIAESYPEHDVPFFELAPVSARSSPAEGEYEMLPGSWAWPPRVG